MSRETKGEVPGLNIARLETLTDGIYAIAMTLLVLNLIIPEVPKAEAATRIPAILTQDWQKFTNYVVSFVLLAFYWMIHHAQSTVLKRTDITHAWLNIFTLMFVVLIPFSFSLVVDYSYLRLTNVIFQCNLGAVGLFTYLSWAYATHHHRLCVPELSIHQIRRGKLRSLLIPVLSAGAVAMTYVSPEHSNSVYLFSFFIKPIIDRTAKKP